MRSCWTVVVLGALALASCSSGHAQSTASSGSQPTTPPVHYTVPLAAITRPTTPGSGIDKPEPAPPLPQGYVESEYFVSGTATSFKALTTPDDGRWTAAPAQTAKYRTRVIVRRPPAGKFSGTVLVEWFNVSALESDPDLAYLNDEIGREGDAYIGVSAQAQGVDGGKTLLDVKVNQKTASSLGQSADTSGLKHIDPARYGSLVHPGDAYAHDIFSQVGNAASKEPGLLLGGLQPKRVLAIGESQSAAFLTTYVDAVHPLDPVFDGFLIHSRGSGGTPLDGNLDSKSAGQMFERGILIRTDLDVPVFMFETETDLTLLGYAAARQPDTNLIRTWEIAGTSHADAQLIRAVIGGPRDPNVGSLIGCTGPINTGPQHEVLEAALAHFVRWAAGGPPPPTGTRLAVTEHQGGLATIARDANGEARGGVRNPLVDVPVATLSGEPPRGVTVADVAKSGGICLLFGRTIAFDRAKLVDLYGTPDKYLAAFRTSADHAVAAGFLLRPDADALVAEAQANRGRFG